MSGAVLVAIAASVGNMIQGWDNACIAGAVLYIKKEFNLQSEPTIEGLIVAMSLIGATLVTTFSGPLSDRVGRRPMLLSSSLLYFIGGLVMLWSPNVYILLLGRLLDGLAIGLAVTLVPVYISETSPPEIRGSLNTLPQFMGSGGMFLSYCMVFGMSLMDSPDWRLMLGVLFIPSLFYFLLTVFFLPESPRWLVSKGRMLEAKRVLQRLRGRDDVAGELALLVEGLGIGGETVIEECIVEEGPPVMASGQESGNGNQQSATLVDPLVTLFSSVHGSKGSAVFPHFGSMFSDKVNLVKPEWDDVSVGGGGGGDGYQSDDDATGNDSDDDLHLPLIQHAPHEIIRNSNNHEEQLSSTDIGGGWQLGWKWSTGQQTTKDGFERVYLNQEIGESLVSHPALYSKDLMDQHPVGPAMVHPAKATNGSSWSDLFEPGVKHALLVGIGLQILQQFSGISGVLYYTPQILEEAGVGILLSNLGISSTSSSLLISNIITLLMLPCIAVAMRLMDLSGRRTLLLTTIPVLILSLIVLVIGGLVNFGNVANAAISTTSVIIYFCCFVMGFGPIPNILCSEIFPTRIRGICIAICALTFWICDIIVTYSLPVMLTSVGLTGVFAFYAVVCIMSWVFVFLKVPETKGMPLEVITEFFSVGAKQVVAEKKI
ncbi:monosaccharide-sensing protein 2-like [Bidens hawaiensis]|uniref:monosaccharide-sensing protein 2-like n=1 Tax=Bidens hawaiensis TaxID=980011 RepID=UPI00404B3735